MKENKGIPKSILSPLSTSGWMHDDYSVRKFETQLEGHRKADQLEGMTSAYSISDRFGLGSLISEKELAAMVREAAVDPEFVNGTAVNQHWLHSLEQFYAIAYREWLAHLARTEALIDTPSGRIWREPDAA